MEFQEFLNYDQSNVNKEVLDKMNQEMLLRGPDDSGHYIDGNCGIAMRRLSIIDLDSGKQPIANETKTIHVVLNGEIYNYIELRKELEGLGHHFSTQSDTEVFGSFVWSRIWYRFHKSFEWYVCFCYLGFVRKKNFGLLEID